MTSEGAFLQLTYLVTHSRMNAHQGPAAPASGTFEYPEDPEILALLDFEPVPRKIKVPGGWTPETQRAFIARLAVHGSIGKACTEVRKDRGGATKLYNSPDGASFRAAWEGAVELATGRKAAAMSGGGAIIGDPSSLDNRRKHLSTGSGQALSGEPGQVLNEYGEWEDEDSYRRRGEEARDSISNKLRRCRRLYLQEISGSPGKRAAFEILTELPIDWEKAERLEPQPDEPWRKPNMRSADMLLTAEAGWFGGEFVHGPDKKAELLREVNAWRAEQGLEPVGWKDE